MRWPKDLLWTQKDGVGPSYGTGKSELRQRVKKEEITARKESFMDCFSNEKKS